MSKVVEPHEVKYLERQYIRLVNLHTQSVSQVRGLYTRWVFYDTIANSVTYAAKNVTLEQALTGWQQLDPDNHFIFILKSDEHESSYDEFRDAANSLSLQQSVEHGSVSTDVDGEAQRCDLLCKSLRIIHWLFHKRNP